MCGNGRKNAATKTKFQHSGKFVTVNLFCGILGEKTISEEVQCATVTFTFHTVLNLQHKKTQNT